MKRNVILISILFLIFPIFTDNTEKENWPVLQGPYLGQKPPGEEPQLFMPGLVSTNNLDICISFLQGGKVCVFSNNVNLIYFTYEKDGQWTKPVKALFPDKKGKTQYTAGSDGKTLYFQSSRPTNPYDKRRDLNTWTVQWTGSGWTEPQPLPTSVNSNEYHEIYPSTTCNKTLYYFSGWRTDAPLGDSYRNKFVNGKYKKAEKLEYPINSEYHEGDPFVASDESCIIFASNRPGGYGFMDLYISFRRDDDSWTHPVNLGKKINSHQHVNTVCITLDHRYFFFSSSRATNIQKGKTITSSLHDRIGDIDLYWVTTDFISDLKYLALSQKPAAPIIDREYQKNGLQSAIKKLKALYASGKDIYHFSLSELLITCGHMIKTGKVKDAEKFYKALLKILPDKFRIKQGYATVNILNGQTVKGTDLLKKVWSEYPSAKSLQALEPIYSHLRFTKRIKDELTLLRFITKEFPNPYFVYYDLALLFKRTGDIKTAITNCKKSLELNPNFSEAQKLLEKLVIKQKEENFPVLKGPYLGQKPPGQIPEIFAPGIISTAHKEHSALAFSPDGKEIYWSIWPTPRSAKIPQVIKFMKIKNGRWSEPQVAPFSGKYMDGGPCFFPDGKKLFFYSRRPVTKNGKPKEDTDIWFVSRTETGWSEPEHAGLVLNSSNYEGDMSFSANGNLYFSVSVHVQVKGIWESSIFRSSFKNGIYSKPIKITHLINTTPCSGNRPFVSQDENFIIFSSDCRRFSPEGKYLGGKRQLVITFRKNDNSWYRTVDMGSAINISYEGARHPGISPDGKYLFFTRYDKNWNEDIYWVDAGIIENLKPEELK